MKISPLLHFQQIRLGKQNISNVESKNSQVVVLFFVHPSDENARSQHLVLFCWLHRNKSTTQTRRRLSDGWPFRRELNPWHSGLLQKERWLRPDKGHPALEMHSDPLSPLNYYQTIHRLDRQRCCDSNLSPEQLAWTFPVLFRITCRGSRRASPLLSEEEKAHFGT